MVECPYDIGLAKARAISLLEQSPPTAIVAGNDIIAQGVLFACQALGVDVPRKMSVVGIGDFRGSAAIEPRLSTVRLPARTIGRLAADAILTLRTGIGFRDTLRREVPFEWVERDSTAPPEL